jgi:CSLREA domain-containing protein
VVGLTVLAFGIFGVVRGRAAGAEFPWSGVFTKIFAGRNLPAFTPAPTTFIVNSTLDDPDATINGVCLTAGGVCTLRAAIMEANATTDGDTINFTIPALGVQTISPTSALPTITQPVTIDGYTQGVSSANTLAVGDNAVINVELNGTSAGALTDGLNITAGSCTVRGLAIYRFLGDGIELGGTAGGNTITGNFIGTNATGVGTTNGNARDGVNISNVGTNTIGGSTPQDRNVISANTLEGVEISGTSATGNFVQGNYIGTDRNGTADVGNGQNGVFVAGPSNSIGGSTATPGQGAGNVISGNTLAGVRITSGGNTNTVAGNLIGLQANGTTALANVLEGVFITNAATTNTIGGVTSDLRNVISGNNAAGASDGVEINGTGTNSNKVQGNYIGTTAAGTTAVPNGGDGIKIANGAQSNTVGGLTATPGTAAGNVISGNPSDGVELVGTASIITSSNTIQGNLIGLQAGGIALLRNTSNGILIDNSSSNTIGGSTSTARNVITGGTTVNSDGVDIQDNPSDNNVVAGNYIGTDINGTADFGAGGDGVRLSGTGPDNNTIGGSATTPGTAPGNVISGNNSDGVEITASGTTGNLVQGNLIGLQVNGTTALANTDNGVLIGNSAATNTVGGSTPTPGTGLGNVISGNTNDGVELNGTTSNLVQGNLIGLQSNGTSALPNVANGVLITNSAGSTSVGGATAGLGNTIAFNGGDGVFVESGVNNAIRRNSIHSNTDLGIDLGPNGVTANDNLDSDTGANNLQNFPIITSANFNTQIIIGRLNSVAGQTFTIDVYKNPTCDGTNGEGRTYLGSLVTAATNGSGDVTFSFTSGVAFTSTDVITATATDSNGNTSEFSACATATLVRLRSFHATRYSDGVELNWESGFEVNNLGYLLYREQNGKRSRVTPSIVAGSALTVGPGNRLTAGYSYSWFDPQGTGDSAYSLEAIDLDGSSQWAGPIYPDIGPKGGQTSKEPRHDRAMLLSEIAADDRDQSSVRSWPCVVCGGSTPLSGGAPSGFEDVKKSAVERPHSKVQQSIAAGKAVKIQVRKSGWYRVTQPELVGAGFDPSSDARMLQLYVDGEEVPISLSTEGSRLGANDTLEFYGIPMDTPTTDIRVYWLVSGSSSGKRMIARRGKLKPADQYSETVSGSFDVTIERSEKLVYFASLLNGDTPNIFGASVRPEPVTQILAARNIDRDSASQPQLEVALQGLTSGNHSVQLEVNGTGIGTMTFADREHPVARFSIAPALLREGDNVASLASMNGQSDLSLIDWVRLTYPRQYKAENNTLVFSAPGGQPVRIDGFTVSNVRIVDVTNPNSPVQLSALASASGGAYAVKVQPVGSGVRTLIAFTEDLMAHPVSVTANQPSSWNAGANGADMVILTHKDFRQAIEPLASLRRSQGLSVAVVDVEDIYDEFSYGAHTPAAIKSFLTTAAVNWSRKPAYLLLVGDSSWDPRNYLNLGENDFVPTKLIDTQALETGSDDWLVDINSVGLPNMAVGRLPVRTAAEANLMVSKIMSYEQERESNAPLRGALMVADTGFEPQSTQTRSLLPSNVSVQTINRADVGNDDIVRGQIVDALNQGPMIVNYYGHGSVRVWTGEGLLSADLADNLTNANRLSVFVMMTCLNGYVSDAGSIESLAEAALKAPNGGAVAVWASSGFTTPHPQFEMNTEFYRLLFSGQPMRLGDAVRNAKAATTDLDVRRTWILLGDPAMRVR